MKRPTIALNHYVKLMVPFSIKIEEVLVNYSKTTRVLKSFYLIPRTQNLISKIASRDTVLTQMQEFLSWKGFKWIRLSSRDCKHILNLITQFMCKGVWWLLKKSISTFDDHIQIKFKFIIYGNYQKRVHYLFTERFRVWQRNAVKGKVQHQFKKIKTKGNSHLEKIKGHWIAVPRNFVNWPRICQATSDECDSRRITDQRIALKIKVHN